MRMFSIRGGGRRMKPVKKIAAKVAILGTDISWKKAPLDDNTWEVWGMNSFWDMWGKYATRWFEIHPVSTMVDEGWNRYSWLTECPIPVYMIKHYKDIPNSIPYPLADVSKGFLKQFSSTFSYEMALAIHEGFKTIGIYGIALSLGTLRERFIELQGLLYWIGVAQGRGIEIQFPEYDEDNYKHKYLYGLDYWNEVKYSKNKILSAINSVLVYRYCIDGVNWKKRYLKK